MKIKHKVILAVLLASEYELTSAEVRSGMTQVQSMMYKDLDDIGKTLGYLRDKGLVANHHSTTYKNGRAILTWVITEKGKQAMKEEESVIEQNHAEETKLWGVQQEQTTITNDTELWINGDNHVFTDDDLKLEFAFQTVRDLFAARPVIEPRTVMNLELKVVALTKIIEFASDDIAALFNDIINDLEGIK